MMLGAYNHTRMFRSGMTPTAVRCFRRKWLTHGNGDFELALSKWADVGRLWRCYVNNRLVRALELLGSLSRLSPERYDRSVDIYSD